MKGSVFKRDARGRGKEGTAYINLNAVFHSTILSTNIDLVFNEDSIENAERDFFLLDCSLNKKL